MPQYQLVLMDERSYYYVLQLKRNRDSKRNPPRPKYIVELITTLANYEGSISATRWVTDGYTVKLRITTEFKLYDRDIEPIEYLYRRECGKMLFGSDPVFQNEPDVYSYSTRQK